MLSMYRVSFESENRKPGNEHCSNVSNHRQLAQTSLKQLTNMIKMSMVALPSEKMRIPAETDRMNGREGIDQKRYYF